MALPLCVIFLLFLLARWNPLLAQDSAQHAVGLRIIVVETSEEAQQLVKRLNQGEDFAAIATKESIDPSAANGGYTGRSRKSAAHLWPGFSPHPACQSAEIREDVWLAAVGLSGHKKIREQLSG